MRLDKEHVLTHVPGMAHVTGMNSIYQPRLVTLMLVVSLASRHVSGITRLVSGITRNVSGITRLVSGITRLVSGITRLVSGITSLTFNASVMIKILNVKQ